MTRPDAQAPEVLTPLYRPDGRDSLIRAPAGTLRIELPCSPSTGYLWEAQPGEAAGQGLELQLETGWTKPPPEVLALERVGGQRTQFWDVHCPAPGQGRLDFVLRRPWEQEVAESFQVHLEILPGPESAPAAVP